MKKIVIIAGLLLCAAAVWFFSTNSENGGHGGFEFVSVERGGIENVVSSTGTIEAVNTVEVGTQVSGIIEHIYVDFNSRVTRNQILAVLDTLTLASRVREEEANVIKNQAYYEQAMSEYNRNKPLFQKGFISEKEFVPIKTDLEVKRASVQMAQVSLERAKINLQYAEIRSPIDGVIIDRSVDPGQTVAASFQTPTLFIVAEDLSKMQILADVDESDIGQIEVGQEVRFTVQSYMDEVFYGNVKQIRLQPETISNVVNYTVVIDASNENGMLLPGMTATIDFIVESVENVLLIPNTALRFEPTEEMILAFREKMQAGKGNNAGMGGNSTRMRGDTPPKDMTRLWFVDENNNVSMRPVRTGATDGVKTEVITGQGIDEGMSFISGFSKDENNDGKESGQQQIRRGPRLF